MDNRKRVTDEEIREQIGRRRGNITAVAQTLRCSRQTVYKRLRQSEELRDTLAEARERQHLIEPSSFCLRSAKPAILQP